MGQADRASIVYVVQNYPQLSQTYIKVEIEALREQFDIHVISIQSKKPNVAYPTTQPHTYTQDIRRMADIVRQMRPLALHGHWLHTAPALHELSLKTGVPYTIRAHSFDVLHRPRPAETTLSARLQALLKGKPNPGKTWPQLYAPLLNQPNCLGMLSFPFTRPVLEKAGLHPEKMIDCFPTIDYRKFFNREANGPGVMNIGACIPKKRVEDFVDLAGSMPERKFRHYAIGYQRDHIEAYNASRGAPVEIMPHFWHEDMPAEYKRHEWLVYTADREFNSVGWPMAVAEAQASGVGVCIANIRPDLKEYLGGAGFVYDSLDEVRKIISQPLPDEIRELGFAQAGKSDIESHKGLLTQLWARGKA